MTSKFIQLFIDSRRRKNSSAIVFILSGPAVSVEKILFLCNPASRYTRCIRISGPMKASEKVPQISYSVKSA
jgi:hypothetical protein